MTDVASEALLRDLVAHLRDAAQVSLHNLLAEVDRMHFETDRYRSTLKSIAGHECPWEHETGATCPPEHMCAVCICREALSV